MYRLMSESGNEVQMRAGASGVALRIDGLSKSYPGAKVASVKDFTLSVEGGGLVALLGPSGCGKTTTLRMIAGLVEPSGGKIYLGTADLLAVPAHKRNIGLVFQHYALFPLLNVFENVAYGLRERRIGGSEIRSRVEAALAMVHLSELGHRRPKELSGGQQQRVALARALVINPNLLLLDEPLSNLDAKLRHQVRDEIKKLQEKLGITTLFVTHDQEEALSMARTIVVMRDGIIEQVGTPQEIYQRPATSFVASFVGSCNFLSATVREVRSGEIDCSIDGSTNHLKLPASPNASIGDRLSVIIRPERVTLAPRAGAKGDEWQGTVRDATYLGAATSYEIDFGSGLRLISLMVNGSAPPLEKNSPVVASWAPDAWRVLKSSH
jgi:spermidine/putrescine ABC transporter ATP-binding subunit